MNQNHLEAEFDRVKSRLKAIAPAHCEVEEIIANVLWVVQRDEDLSRCSTRSILESVMDGLAMGLDPSGLTGEGTLIPRKTKNGGLRATFVPDYRALLRLALSHPRISHIEARVVRRKDDFTLDFGDPDGRIIHHRPSLNPGDDEPIGVYAIAWFRDSFRPLVEWMTKTEIEANAERGGSYGNDSSPWETDWGEMARKTVIKRFLKYLPFGSSADVCPRQGKVGGMEIGNIPRDGSKEDQSGEMRDGASMQTYRRAIAEATGDTIEGIIRSIREDDSLDHEEKTELFNIAVARKKELKTRTT